MPGFRGLATVTVEARPPQVWIGRVRWEDGVVEGSSEPALLFIRALADEKVFGITPPDESVPGMWTGEVTPAGVPFTVRPTTESDTIGAIAFGRGGMPAVPMPLSVIEYIVDSNGEFIVPNLYALSEDDGFVVTMLLNADAGLYVRLNSAWHLLTDDDVVDGLNYTEAAAAALDMFDQFDRAGQLVHVSAMQRADGEDPTRVPSTEGATPPPEPVVAAMVAKDVPEFTSEDDLPAVIQAAMDNPDLRWWAERRMKALGIQADLPWHDDHAG